MKRAGIKKSPWRAVAMMTAGVVFRIFWRYMFDITTIPVSGKERHW